MNVGVLVCGELGLEPLATAGTRVAVIDDLCHSPSAAAEALKGLGAECVVVGLCESRPSPELVGALCRAGAQPFGIEPVMLRGHERETPHLLAGAVAKLERLAPSEHGKPMLAAGERSRRALFSPRAMVTHAPVAILDGAACLGSTRCGLCASRCPVGAIDPGAPLPSIDEDACTACGACVACCPADALRLSGSSTSQIAAQLEPLIGHVDGVVLACRSASAAAPPRWALVELPTLALVTLAWILQIRATGTMVALAPCDQPCCAGSRDVEELAELIVAAADAADGGAAAPLHLAEPRGTADALLALMPDGKSLTVEHSASPLGLLELDTDRCTVCGACSITCPTDALSLEEGTSAIVLKHDPQRCVGCDRCTTVCPEDAIAVRSGIDLRRLRAGVIEVMRAERERCMVCGANLPPAPMRRRLRELLPQLGDAPPELCAACASKAARRPTFSGNASQLERGQATSVRAPSQSYSRKDAEHG